MNLLDFTPLPLLGNPHLQTLLGNLLGEIEEGLSSHRVLVPLADGDRLVLHDTQPDTWRPGAPVALLVHGLGGCHRSGYLLRITSRLAQQGVRVFRMDLRGAGAGLRLARRLYNAASAPDVRAAAQAVAVVAPHSPLWVVGFSLGGNIVLNFAAAAAAEPVAALRAVAAIAPPIDLRLCSGLMARQTWYNAYYVRQLIHQVQRHQRHFTDVPRTDFPARLTLRDFDELYTAPRAGFADADEYYRLASALPHIAAIRVPTFILTARDDPFIAVEPFEMLRAGPAVEVHIAPRGGHLGFLGPDGKGGIRWAETRLLDWLQSQT